MTALLLAVWGSGMLVVARGLCGRWVNHLSLYTTTWTVMLLALSFDLIHYHHIVLEAWIYIFVAWVAIYLGTAIVNLLPRAPARKTFPDIHMKRLRNIILLLSAAGITSSAVLASNIVRALATQGLFAALTEYGNQIYTLRFQGEVSGMMYFNFLPYAGCTLAGIYTARLGKVTFAAILPLFAILLDGFLSMQRAGMVFGTFLLVSSYFLAPKSSEPHLAKWVKVGVILPFLVAFIGATVQRGGAAYYEGETQALYTAGDHVSVIPNLYFYATCPIPCFSEYLKHPEDDGKALWGRYMFASIYRLLAKFGMDTYVSYYQNFYYTPAPVNVGTYLRELHRDFGGTAIFVFPFMLGLGIATLERRAPSMGSIIVLSFLYLVTFFSFDIDFIGGGTWYFPLPIALLVGIAVKKRSVWRHGTLPSAASAIPS